MVGTQLYVIITQISTYDYMFRPCLVLQDEISSAQSTHAYIV